MLSTARQYQVLRYLGWPVRTIDATSISYSNIIASRLTGFPDDAASILEGMLDRLDEIDGQLRTMVARSNVKQVDDIQFFEDGTFDLRRERVRVIKEIASLMDMPIGPGATGGSMGVVSV